MPRVSNFLNLEKVLYTEKPRGIAFTLDYQYHVWKISCFLIRSEKLG